jgi:hypothetical protein
VGVRSSTLGRGTFSSSLLIFSGGGPWTFTASDGKSHLWGHGNVNLGAGNSFPFEGTVFGGNSKFAGVTGGEIKLDREPITPPGVCFGLDPSLGNTHDPQFSWDHRQDASPNVMGTQGWLVGYLAYG